MQQLGKNINVLRQAVTRKKYKCCKKLYGGKTVNGSRIVVRQCLYVIEYLLSRRLMYATYLKELDQKSYLFFYYLKYLIRGYFWCN